MTVRELQADEEMTPVGTVRELGPDEEVIPDLTPIQKFGRGANVGIAQMLGAPVDFANMVLGVVGIPVSREPIGGSEMIRRGFAALGIAPPPGQDDPDTYLGSVGKMTGAAATTLLTLGAGPLSAAAGGQKATTAGGAIVQDIAKSALKAPGRFIGAETVAAVGAGTGGFAARQMFPDSEAASIIGEIMGGVAPSVVVGAAKITPTVLGIRYARKIAADFGPQQARIRATQRMKEAVQGPQVTMEGEFLPGLTPAQKTGDPGLLSLEKAVIESSEELKGKAAEQVAQVTKTIRDSMKGLGDGVPLERTAENLGAAREYVQTLLETRMKIAAQRADERIASLGPKATREEANLIVREELDKALAAARQQERDLWGNVPQDLALPTAASKIKFQEIKTRTPKAQADDISPTAQKFLAEKGEFGDAEPVLELQGLRSKLLEESRKARSEGKYNKARIADEIADSILDDLGAQKDNIRGEAGERLRAALDFSFDLNEKFTRGTVARVLGTERRGGAVVAPELTLEKTVAVGGPTARVQTRALMEAADTPQLRGAVEDFLSDEFHRNAVKNGKINPGAADAFMKRYQDVLQDFPDFSRKLQDAIASNEVATITQRRAEGLARRLNDPRVSRAAIFLKEPIEGAMKRVAESPNPEKTMIELVKQAGRDETGDALKGLKTGFGDYLLSLASTKKATVKDDFIVSGLALKKLLSEGAASKMAKALFSSDELNRLNVIAETAERLEKSIAAAATKKGIITAPPNMLFSLLARIGGAQLGRVVAERTGGGTVQTPGMLANVMKKLTEKAVQDPAQKILIDAMQDENLFKALLSDLIVMPKAQEEIVTRQLNAWLAEATREATDALGNN